MTALVCCSARETLSCACRSRLAGVARTPHRVSLASGPDPHPCRTPPSGLDQRERDRRCTRAAHVPFQPIIRADRRVDRRLVVRRSRVRRGAAPPPVDRPLTGGRPRRERACPRVGTAAAATMGSVVVPTRPPARQDGRGRERQDRPRDRVELREGHDLRAGNGAHRSVRLGAVPRNAPEPWEAHLNTGAERGRPARAVVRADRRDLRAVGRRPHEDREYRLLMVVRSAVDNRYRGSPPRDHEVWPSSGPAPRRPRRPRRRVRRWPARRAAAACGGCGARWVPACRAGAPRPCASGAPRRRGGRGRRR